MNPSDPPSSGTAIAAALSAREPADDHALARARAFAEPLLVASHLDTGENTLAHADAMVGILALMGGSPEMQAAAYLVYACQYLQRPQEIIAKAFGDSYAHVAVETHKLLQLQRQARQKTAQVRLERELAQQQSGFVANAAKAQPSELDASQTENVRKMLLAFSRDLRVVMLRLASRLQTLRYYAAAKKLPERALAQE